MKLSHSTGSLRERLRQTMLRAFVSREAETKSGENLSEAEISRSRFNRFRETASPLFCSCFETRRKRKKKVEECLKPKFFGLSRRKTEILTGLIRKINFQVRTSHLQFRRKTGILGFGTFSGRPLRRRPLKVGFGLSR